MPSSKQTRKPLSDETKKNISSALKGKKKTQEHVDKVAAALTGKHLSSAHKRNIAKALRGRKRSPETIAKALATRKANGSYKHTEESKQRMRLAKKDWKPTLAHKRAISRGLKGRQLSAEARAKIGRSSVARFAKPEHRLSVARAHDRARGDSKLYIVSFPKLKGIYKVGVSKDIKERVKQVKAWIAPLGKPTIHLYLDTPLTYECEHIIHMHFKADGEWVKADKAKLIAYARHTITRMKRKARGSTPRCGGAPSPTGVSTPTPAPTTGSGGNTTDSTAAEDEDIRLAA